MRQGFIFNAFINLEPVQRSVDGCDMRRFRSFNHSNRCVMHVGLMPVGSVLQQQSN